MRYAAAGFLLAALLLLASAGCGHRNDTPSPSASAAPVGAAAAQKNGPGLHAMEAHPAPSGPDGLPP